MNGYQRWVLNGIKQHCPQLFERITGMTPDAFERAYNPKDEQFCKRMKERHKRFKATLDELRDLPTAEAQRRMPVMFPGLDEDGKRVLSVLVSESSKKKLAQKANMPLEKFMQKAYELEEFQK